MGEQKAQDCIFKIWGTNLNAIPLLISQNFGKAGGRKKKYHLQELPSYIIKVIPNFFIIWNVWNYPTGFFFFLGDCDTSM